MKKLTLLALLAAGLASAVSAAITAGLEVGYLTDNKDAIWSGRVGWQFASTVNLSHQVELELAHTQHTESGMAIGPSGVVTAEAKSKLTPLMINYRAETTAANKLGFYFGAGVGQSKVKFSFVGSGVPLVSDSANAFAYQAFAGVRYNLTPQATLHAGVKYLKIDDADMFGSTLEVGDDLALTAGLDFRF